ncbi:MAG: carboxylating nicotinate-nucleotide diphosphorylase [Thermoplasmata archaeon]|nr:MAG: carboxylating nicotinate-nucleotide diphosphorylase [Thermoplasmata archaeon]
MNGDASNNSSGSVRQNDRLHILLGYLEEDAGRGDITTEALGISAQCKAEVVAKSPTVVAGMEAIKPLVEHFKLKFEVAKQDGKRAQNGDLIFTLEGDGAVILKLERLILNIISRMSGIAAATNEIVEQVHGVNSDCIVAATRKTTPGFRTFEKEAVVIGGGHPHRYDLEDAVMIKDNHLKFVSDPGEALKRAMDYVSSLDEKVSTALKWGEGKPGHVQKWVEIEADTYEQAESAVSGGADIVMLDNMTPAEVEKAYKKLKAIRGDVLIEISGGITSENILDYARHADIISLGWLTHSAPAANFSMNVLEIQNEDKS